MPRKFPVYTLFDMNCVECGKQFQAKKKNRKYCSAVCRQNNMYPRQKPVEATCPVCGVLFVKKALQKYCSKSCGYKVQYEANAEAKKLYSKTYREERREHYREMDRKRHYEKRDRILERMTAREKERRIRYPWLSIYNGARKRAAQSGLPFEITTEWCAENYTGVCALTGIPFRKAVRGGGPEMFSPGLDKIVPALGYTPSNARFILTAINMMKNTGSDEDVYLIAEALLKARAERESK